MRKYLVMGALAVSAMGIGAGAILAQDATEEAPTAVTSTTWLGVALVEQDGQVIIARVQTGSPADTADLEIGDVVTAFNGTEITSGEELTTQIQAAAAGDMVTLDVLRNDEALSIEVTLGSAPAFGFGRGDRGFPGGREFAMPTDALTLAEMLLRADLEEAAGGYTVAGVMGRNPLELEVGDLITTVNELPVTELSLDTLRASLEAAETPALTISVERDGETVTLEAGLMLRGLRGRGGMGRGFGAPPAAPEADVTPESTADI